MPRWTRPEMPFAAFAWLAACAALIGGCQRDATLIKWAEAPDIRVKAVELVAVSGEGASAAVDLDLNSGADVALPLTRARYTVEMNGRSYQGETKPNAVLPAGRSLTVRLPAAVAGEPGDRYRVRGSIEYEPPGQIRKVLTDLGVPLPSKGFSGEGALIGEPRRVEDVPAAPADASPPTEPEGGAAEEGEAPGDGRPEPAPPASEP